MPKLKRKSQGQIRLSDKKRKREVMNLDEKVQDTTTSVQNAISASLVPQIIGTHDESFTDIDIDEVLAGELDIRILDYTSQIIKMQFNCVHGMLPPSFLHQLVHEKNPQALQKILLDQDCVQIHYVANHYLVSAQINKQRFILNSLANNFYVTEVASQLKLLYDNFNLSQFKVYTPQSQGSTTLCGIFAVANSCALLRSMKPSSMHFHVDKMRRHLHQCLKNGYIDEFPHVVLSSIENNERLDDYFADQKMRLKAFKEKISHSKPSGVILKSLLRKHKRQQDKTYKDDETLRETTTRRDKRKDEAYRQNEQVKDTAAKCEKRKDKAYKDDETLRETTTRRDKRKDKAYRQNEQVKDTAAKCEKRKDEAYRRNEQVKDTAAKCEKRKDKAYKEDETLRETNTRRDKRKDNLYKGKEIARETSLRKEKRSIPSYKVKEKNRESNLRRKKRLIPFYQRRDQLYDLKSKRLKRQLKQSLLKSKLLKHRRCWKRKKVRISQNRHSEGHTCMSTLISKFRKTVTKGPIYICVSCNQLWYKHSVIKASTLQRSAIKDSKVLDVFQKCVQPQASSEWICKTCASYIRKRKIPPSSAYNGMQFPHQGPLKDMNSLELSLLAPILPFMKIHKATVGKQLKIEGNMVLVPSAVKNSVNSLPRLPSETATIKAKLKRRLRYNHHIYSLNIRPELIRAGVEYLSTTSQLYKDHNITFSEVPAILHPVPDEEDTNEIIATENFSERQCLDEINTELTQSSNIDMQKVNNAPPCASQYDQNEEIECQILSDNKSDKTPIEQDNDSENESDNWSECDPSEFNPGVLDTLLTAPDFVEPEERDFVYNFAPAEGNKPVSIFLEENAEELAFPGIFCGQARKKNEERPARVHYSEIVKSELRNRDRRAASCVENIFFKTKKIQMKQLIDQTNIVVRKYKTKGKTLTAGDVKGNAVNDFIHRDKAYKFMASLRGSPPYFQSVAKNLFAMIRQLGPSTFFCSLSAAETRWPHLLSILSKNVNDTEISEEEALNLTWAEKSFLIQNDPVTCARHFDFSVSKFISEFLLTHPGPLGNILDYFYRVEYQQRGSPHIHMMVWCKNVPVYGKSSNEEITAFIDKFITCCKPVDDSELAQLVNLQIHRHSHTCRKKGRKQCRFGFPKPPMTKTMILEPLSVEEEDEDEKQIHKDNWNKIHSVLNCMKSDDDINFETFLQDLGITEDQYISAIRSSIRSPTVFLKRKPSEIRVNGYNPNSLLAWRANLDLQYVLDVYACATYIASYITKSQRGMSELLRKACDEAKAGNQDIREQVRNIGNKFLNAVEISAQEAVYICLGIPMKKSSRSIVFVNTSPPMERVSLLKPQNQIMSMDDDDEDIECSNIIKRYSDRSKLLENVTLAEFAAFYDGMKTKHKNSTCKDTPSDHAEGSCDEENIPDMDNNQEQRNNKEPKRRKIPRIIRYVHFNPDVAKENYYREQIMLFTHWRDENTELMGNALSFEERFKQLSDSITEERLKYEPFRDEVDEAERNIENLDFENVWNHVAPNAEHLENCEQEQMEQISSDNQPESYDIGPDLGIKIVRSEDELNIMYEIPDQEFRMHCRSLTKEQIAFVYDTMHELKTSTTPVYRFLSGGAGVGKSHVIKALYQMAIKHFNKLPGQNFETPKVLMLAPTGKAAYHIHGNTIHSGLKIAVNQKLEHKPLTSSTLNTFRNQLGDISLLIIDEISMVGFNLFNCVHQRLQELKQSKEYFGGISIVCVGDLFQLKPVMDSYIFSPSGSQYMPLATNLWMTLFKMVELTQIMRQRENLDFAKLLNRLREGNSTDEDITTLNTRMIKPHDIGYPIKAVHLFTTNERVNHHNYETIQNSTNMVFEVKSRDRLVGSCSQEMKDKILQSFKNNSKHQMQLAETLQLVEGMHYDITVNMDTKDGLTNGTSCTLMKIELKHLQTYPDGPLWVQFEHDEIGKSIRSNSKHLYKASHQKNWTPLMPVSRQFAAGHKGQAQVQRLQYPLRPAAGKTIHRSQGDSMNEAVIDLSSRRKIDHIHYVALSRLTNLNGLHLLQLNSEQISVSKSVKHEMERLRESKLEYNLKFLYDVPASSLKIAFFNARSLHRHIEDFGQDYSLQSADIVASAETRFQHTDVNTDIPNWYSYRNDSNIKQKDIRSHYGMCVYSKRMFNPEDVLNLNFDGVEMILLKLHHAKQELVVLFLYKFPKTSVNNFIQFLRIVHDKYLLGRNVIIMGDFNIDVHKCSSISKNLLDLLESSLGYHQVIKSATTDYGTIIDLIFTNLSNVQSGTLELYYSDHKAVWLAV